MRLTSLLLTVVLVMGCSMAKPYKVSRQFDEAEFKPYAGTGTSKIVGQAFLITEGGDRKFGAGQKVFLIPAVPYNVEVFRAAYAGKTLTSASTDTRRRQYDRCTTADGDGRFEFDSIPAGTYFLECSIFWTVGSGTYSRGTGGVAKATAKVAPGETTRAILHDVIWNPEP